jgi:hypothetical protein
MQTRDQLDEAQPSAAELEAMEEFLALQRQGQAPEVEAFLARYPDLAPTLRPVLEGAVMVKAGFEDLKQRCPAGEFERRLGLDR